MINRDPGVTVKLPKGARILIAGEDEGVDQQPKTVFKGAALMLKTMRSTTAACRFAKSGRFQALVSTPALSDGPWRRSVDIAKHYDLGFEVVVMARHFDLLEWSEALRDGAFDVIDAASQLPIASETMKRALWAAYLKSARIGVDQSTIDYFAWCLDVLGYTSQPAPAASQSVAHLMQNSIMAKRRAVPAS